MTNLSNDPFCKKTGGFSLVEVTLAIAIVAIGLLAVLSLLPQGLGSARNAADNTLVATIVQDAFSSLRSSGFTNATLDTVGSFSPAGPYNLTNSLITTIGYFDKSGLTPAGTGDRYYQVTLDFSRQGGLALSRVTATVLWPALAAVPPNTNVFVTEIARYQ